MSTRLSFAAARLLIAMATVSPAVVAAQEAGVRRSAAVDPQYTCITCHIDKRADFVQGVHSERGIRCHDCHGGDPTAFEVEGAHGTADFIGAPTKVQTVELCAACHSDPDLMRQYGLDVGQLAEFRTSRHGQLLLQEGDMNAPTCTDCHDAHTILPPSDARSNVYPTNIVATCARCHEDPELMEPYGIPTDQVGRFRSSAHGVALFEHGNFAAPTCVGCHGSHAALPPRVSQIANVCGQCHVLVRQAFYDGPHGAAALAGNLPGCTACHSNHGTEGVPPSNISETCTRCHAAESGPALVGVEVEQEAMQATTDLLSAEEAIEEMVGLGHQTADTRFRYRTALTAHRQIALAQHSLDLDELGDLSREVASITRDIRNAAEVAAEERWEHKLILIPVWFLALSAAVLGAFMLRVLRKGA